jgi:RimJ/RimL family protein N-acetyltransferase
MISIRKLIKDDVYFLNSVRNECAEKYLHDSRTFSIQDSYKWFETTNPEYYLILYNDVSIGYFRTSNYSIANHNIYIGADLHRDWRGKGLAYKAYRVFIPFLFDKHSLNKISLEVLSTNIVAKNLYRKLGFVFEGTKREEVHKKDRYVDSEVWSILKKEYSYE